MTDDEFRAQIDALLKDAGARQYLATQPKVAPEPTAKPRAARKPHRYRFPLDSYKPAQERTADGWPPLEWRETRVAPEARLELQRAATLALQAYHAHQEARIAARLAAKAAAKAEAEAKRKAKAETMRMRLVGMSWTLEELQRWQHAADAAGLTLSEWIRRAVNKSTD